MKQRKMVEIPQRYGTCALVALLTLSAISGCSQLKGSSSRTASLTIDDILGRCETVYQHAETIHARGVLQDDREVLPIGWDYASPHRCRLQIGMNVALIGEEDWWTYDGKTDRFRSHCLNAETPIETAASWLSDGGRFLLPSVLGKGSKALSRQDGPWQLDGLVWLAEWPCYVVSRPSLDRHREGRLKVWIDQDTFVIRRWAWDSASAEDRGKTIWCCTYYDVTVNAPLSSNRFQVQRPSPIVLTRGGPGGIESESDRSNANIRAHAMAEPAGRY